MQCPLSLPILIWKNSDTDHILLSIWLSSHGPIHSPVVSLLMMPLPTCPVHGLHTHAVVFSSSLWSHQTKHVPNCICHLSSLEATLVFPTLALILIYIYFAKSAILTIFFSQIQLTTKMFDETPKKALVSIDISPASLILPSALTWVTPSANLGKSCHTNINIMVIQHFILC